MPASKSLKKSLRQDLPVLFAYIGWAEYYDGTEAIKGNFKWVKKQPTNNSECKAFCRDPDGYYYCGAGSGMLPDGPFHVVFVARDPGDGRQKFVGLYTAARAVASDNAWKYVRTRTALLIPAGNRLPIPPWPGSNGVRRWARGASETHVEHLRLHKFFRKIAARVIQGKGFAKPSYANVSADPELFAFEGTRRKLLVTHRLREWKLRRAKIQAAMQENRGELQCEVPGCGFDFVKRYGEVARGFALVHHLRPLNEVNTGRRRTRLKDLAVVCANCHAVIHRGGGCRPLKGLILS